MARVITSYAGPEIEMEDAWLKDQQYLKPSISSTTNMVEVSQRRDDRLTRFQCKICLETASEAVVTPCGHLFCWPCIYTWITTSSKNSDECPVCKGYVASGNLTPIYGEGQPPESRRGKDGIPPRPKARREDKYGGKVHHRHAPVRQQNRSRDLPHTQTLQ